MEELLIPLVPLVRMALPFVFLGFAIVAHMYVEDNRRDGNKSKEKIFMMLTYIFGAIAFYLFFFAGIYNIFGFDPNEHIRIFAP